METGLKRACRRFVKHNARIVTLDNGSLWIVPFSNVIRCGISGHASLDSLDGNRSYKPSANLKNFPSFPKIALVPKIFQVPANLKTLWISKILSSTNFSGKHTSFSKTRYDYKPYTATKFL